MKIFYILLFVLSLQTHAQQDERKQPKIITGDQKYATEESGKSQEDFGEVGVHDNKTFAFLYIDRLEQRLQKDDGDVLLWDINGWAGNDYHKLFIKTEGVLKESQNEILYSRSISAYWDAQFGYRHDLIKKKDDRDFIVVGGQGTTPYLFEVDAALYVSDEGDVSTIAEIEYSFQLSQRMKFIPRFEFEIAFQDVEQYSIGSGVTGFEVGGRLSYEIIREFAPYVGVSLEKKVFETANMMEAEGKSTDHFAVVLGARLVL